MYRIPVLAVVTAVLAFSGSASADPNDPFRDFGKAPPSLDYPVEALAGNVPGFSRSKSALERRAELNREELFFLSVANPFPTAPIPAIDPISGKRVHRVLTGPAFRARGNGSGFDYYRYVSFFNVATRKERAYDFPEHYEECHDNGAMFASYGKSVTWTASVTASVSYEGLGLSATLSQSQTHQMGRQLIALGGARAVHTPYYVKSDWDGRTLIQTYDSRSGRTAFLTEERDGSAWWVRVLFPLLAETKYPMEFSVRDADWGFAVERTVLSYCNNGFGE